MVYVYIVLYIIAIYCFDLKESYDRAKKLLVSKQHQMNLLAEALLEYEELTYEEAKIIIEGGKLNRQTSGGHSSSNGPSDKGAATPKKPKINSDQIKPVKLWDHSISTMMVCDYRFLQLFYNLPFLVYEHL